MRGWSSKDVSALGEHYHRGAILNLASLAKKTGESKALIAAKSRLKIKTDDCVLRTLRTRMERYGTLAPVNVRPCTWKQGWRDIRGDRIFFRSRWEFNYALYLEFMKGHGHVFSWEHEPETFWFPGIKRGCVSYLPDFRVRFTNGKVEYHEVKGWMDERSVTKIKRMAKYYPNVVLKVVDKVWFKTVAYQVRSMIPGWET